LIAPVGGRGCPLRERRWAISVGSTSEFMRIIEGIIATAPFTRSLVCRLQHARTHPIDGGA